MAPQNKDIKQILMTADSAGGVWTYAMDLCAALNKFGIRVFLAIMGPPMSPGQQTEAEQYSNLTVRQRNYKLEWMDNPWQDVEDAGRWLLDLEKEIKPDLIHLNGYSHASLNWTAPVVVVAHSCVLSWWKAVKQESAPDSWSVYQDRVKHGLQIADAVVAVSHSYANELQAIYGSISKLSVIYHGRNSEAFYELEKKDQAFAMGRIWDEAKNLELLGKVSGKLNLKILLAGDNTHPETKKEVDVHHVVSLGLLTQSAIRKHLAESFIYIHPAVYEPFGLAVLEAALSGCLLVLANIPTFKELWQNTALYFDPRDPEELERVLEYIRQHPQVCRGLINRSGERAKFYSVDTMGQQYYDLYKSLVFPKAMNREILYR